MYKHAFCFPITALAHGNLVVCACPRVRGDIDLDTRGVHALWAGRAPNAHAPLIQRRRFWVRTRFPSRICGGVFMCMIFQIQLSHTCALTYALIIANAMRMREGRVNKRPSVRHVYAITVLKTLCEYVQQRNGYFHSNHLGHDCVPCDNW